MLCAGGNTDDVAINDIPQNQEGIDEVVKEIEALGRRSVGVPAGEPFSHSFESLL